MTHTERYILNLSIFVHLVFVVALLVSCDREAYQSTPCEASIVNRYTTNEITIIIDGDTVCTIPHYNDVLMLGPGWHTLTALSEGNEIKLRVQKCTATSGMDIATMRLFID